MAPTYEREGYPNEIVETRPVRAGKWRYYYGEPRSISYAALIRFSSEEEALSALPEDVVLGKKISDEPARPVGYGYRFGDAASEQQAKA